MENLKTLIETLYPMNAYLLGVGYDNRLEYMKHLLDMKIIEVPSGTEFGTWTVPQEWIPKDAWVKFNGEKILDFKKDPLSLLTYSDSFQGTISKEDLLKKLHTTNDFGDNHEETIPYMTSFYEKKWGLCMSEKQRQTLEEGDYEVFIDTEFKNGAMKMGVFTKPGKTDREVLLFAHLDHPYQANDNLSGVACTLDVIKKIDCEHTIKVVFCPETIGSIAYSYLEDLSKVDFMIAVDICGNDNSLLAFKTLQQTTKLDYATHCALQSMGKQYRKARFRSTIGSDETVFNDPKIGIPGILLSRHPYKEYHTASDTPDKINYEKIQETADYIIRIIDIYEKDFVPVRNFHGQLMRSRYGMQTISKQVNLNRDYFFYAMDGKKSLVELCTEYEMPFDVIYEEIKKIEADGKISRADVSESGQQQTTRKKSPRLPRSSNVRGKSKKV